MGLLATILVGPGSMSPNSMEGAWMASAPHRANILNANFTQIGVGIHANAHGQLYFCVDFGRPYGT